MDRPGGAEFEPGSELVIEEDITLSATWTKDKDSIDLTLIPGIIKGDDAIITTIEGNSITLPSGDDLWETEEYSFSGWSTSSGGTVTYKAGETFTASKSTTLYAVWTANPKITYKANGGTGKDIIEYHKNGENITIKNTSFKKTGYSFSCWSTSNSNSGTKYEAGSECTIDKDLTLYAIWVENKDAVTITLSNSTGSPVEINSVQGQKVVLPSGDDLWKTKEYSFSGWSTSSGGTATYKAGETYTASKSTTLYAVWTANPKITYKANGGTGDDIIEYHKSGEKVTIKNTGFTKVGYSLSYWSTSENGTTRYIPGEEYTIKNDLALYAIWAKNKVTLTYNNGGSGTIYSVTVDPETEIQLDSGSSLNKNGYYITSWNTSSDGNGDSYALNGTIAINSDTTLYAVWTESLYIKYYSGGKCIKTQYLNGEPGIIGDAGLTPEEGYELFWSTKEYSGAGFGRATIYEIGDEYSGSVNLTLYAKYDDKDENYIYTLVSTDNNYNYYSIKAASTDFAYYTSPFYHRDGYVKAIEKYAFKECKNIKSYSIYMDTSVKDYAFLGCSNLEKVTFAPDVSVSSTAFMDCPKLSYFNIAYYCSGNWREIFSHCAEAISIDYEGGIGENEFKACSTLTTANITGGEYDNSIGAHAFKDCTALTSITIKAMKSINQDAFEGCESLKKIIIYGEENSISGYETRWGAPEGTTIEWNTTE